MPNIGIIRDILLIITIYPYNIQIISAYIPISSRIPLKVSIMNLLIHYQRSMWLAYSES